MFDFFKTLKNRVAALEADVKAIYGHIKAEFAAKEAAVAAIDNKVVEAVDAEVPNVATAAPVAPAPEASGQSSSETK